MTDVLGDRDILIAGKKHTLKPFKLKQLRTIARLSTQNGDDPQMQADFGFTVLEMGLANAEPSVGEVEELQFETGELKDAMDKVMKLTALAPKDLQPGEATAPAPGA